jgi:tRNA pseudouridine38-40 synthase
MNDSQEPRRRVRLLVAYDGTRYSGFARNEDIESIQATLEERLAIVLQVPVRLVAAGRTDKGVHARGQVVTFDAPADADLDRLQRSLNTMGGGEIVVRSADIVADDFHARFSAMWRRYRYTVDNGSVVDPFRRSFAWWMPDDLSVAEMNVGAGHVLGEHDFSAFCRRPRPVDGADFEPTMVRRVHEAAWSATGSDRIVFEIRASAFCHQMVRSIVGALVDVGRGKLQAADIAKIIASEDRSEVPNLAPPQGLCLEEVGYRGSA